MIGGLVVGVAVNYSDSSGSKRVVGHAVLLLLRAVVVVGLPRFALPGLLMFMWVGVWCPYIHMYLATTAVDLEPHDAKHERTGCRGVRNENFNFSLEFCHFSRKIPRALE